MIDENICHDGQCCIIKETCNNDMPLVKLLNKSTTREETKQ